MGLTDYIKNGIGDGEPVTSEAMGQLMQGIHESMARKPRHPKNGPVMLSDDELAEFHEFGSVYVYWDDGTTGYILSKEKRCYLQKVLEAGGTP